jgi:hypothetical protein
VLSTNGWDFQMLKMAPTEICRSKICYQTFQSNYFPFEYQQILTTNGSTLNTLLPPPEVAEFEPSKVHTLSATLNPMAGLA